MISVDYRKISHIGGDELRMEQALKECAEYGLEKNKAIDLVAISVREVEAVIIQPRPAIDADYPDHPHCWRGPVGIEWADWTTFEWPYPAQNDVEFLTYLASFGWVGSVGGKNTGQGQITNGNSQAQAVAFEWMIAHRRWPLKKTFSLGPTQLYLAYSDRPGGPKTLEQAWAAYAVSNAGEAFDAVKYLEPANNRGLPYPTNTAPTASIEWLKGHAGSCASEYYYGEKCGWVPAVPAYKAWMNSAVKAREIADRVY